MSATTRRRRSPGGVALIVLGAIVSLVALAVLAGGGALLWADQTQRDPAGYFATSTERFATGTYAITHEDAKLVDIPSGIDVDKWAKIRIRATSADGRQLFVGIARQSDVDAYLGNVSHAKLTDFDTDPFRATYERAGGAARPAPPASRQIWAASATGAHSTLTWPVHKGTWGVVVMNADGSRGVAADVNVGADVHYLGWISGGLFGIGAILLGIAVLFVVFGSRGRPPGGAAAPPGPSGSSAAAGPGT